MLGTGPGLGHPQEDAPGPGAQPTLSHGRCGSHTAASLQGRQAWGPPEMRLLHFVTLRASPAVCKGVLCPWQAISKALMG